MKLFFLVLSSITLVSPAYASDMVKALSVREMICTDAPQFAPVVPSVTLKLTGTREGIEVAYTTSQSQLKPVYLDTTAPLNLASEGTFYLQLVHNKKLNLFLKAKSQDVYIKLARNSFFEGEQFLFSGNVWIDGVQANVNCTGVFNRQ